MNEQKFHVGIKALFANHKNEILLLRVNPKDFDRPMENHWDLPGGRIEEGHPIEETLRKEIKEELNISNFQIIEHLDTHISNMKIPVGNEEVGLLIVVYKCKFLDETPDITLNNEHLEYKWFPINQAGDLLKFKFGSSLIDKISQLETS